MRMTLVARAAKLGIEGDAAEKRHAQLGREPLAPTLAEDLRRHVLDDTDDAHAGLLRHRRGARRDFLRERLRRRHDDRLRARQQLTE